MQFFHFLLCVAIVVWVHAGYMFIRLLNKSPRYQTILEDEQNSQDDIGYMCCYIGFYGHYNNPAKGKDSSRNYLIFYAFEENTRYCNSKTTPPEVPRSRFDKIIEFYHGTTARCDKLELIDQIINFINNMVRPRIGVRITKLRTKKKMEFASKENESRDDDDLVFNNNDVETLLYNYSGIVMIDRKSESITERSFVPPTHDILSFCKVNDLDVLIKPDIMRLRKPEVPTEKNAFDHKKNNNFLGFLFVKDKDHHETK